MRRRGATRRCGNVVSRPFYGGTAGQQYDPCYHQACDTADNVSLEVLDLNADAIAFAVLQYLMNTQAVNVKKGKGNFKSAVSASPERLGHLLVR